MHAEKFSLNFSILLSEEIDIIINFERSIFMKSNTPPSSCTLHKWLEVLAMRPVRCYLHSIGTCSLKKLYSFPDGEMTVPILKISLSQWNNGDPQEKKTKKRGALNPLRIFQPPRATYRSFGTRKSVLKNLFLSQLESASPSLQDCSIKGKNYSLLQIESQKVSSILAFHLQNCP